MRFNKKPTAEDAEELFSTALADPTEALSPSEWTVRFNKKPTAEDAEELFVNCAWQRDRGA